MKSFIVWNNLRRQTRETRHNHPLSYIPIIDTRIYRAMESAYCSAQQ